jgi:hypothetical protein
MKIGRAVVGLGLVAAVGVCGPGHAAAPGAKGAATPAKGRSKGATTAADSAVVREPSIYLSWSAPYGTPGARDAIMTSCADSTAAETLFISFDPGRDQARLIGYDANVFFRPTPGDTLGPYWYLGRNVRVDFEEAPPGAPSPWPVMGAGMPRYRKDREIGQLPLTFSVPANEAGPVKGGIRYHAARIILRHKGVSEGCGQPVCVELYRLKPAYGPSGTWIMAGERFVSRNSPDGGVCSEYRQRPPGMDPLQRVFPADSTKK